MPWNYAKWKIWKEKKSMFRGESIWYYSSGWGPQIDSRPSDILVVPVMTTTTSQILALYLLYCIYLKLDGTNYYLYWTAWNVSTYYSTSSHQLFLLWIFVIQCVPFIHWFYCENISTMHSCLLGRNWSASLYQFEQLAVWRQFL